MPPPGAPGQTAGWGTVGYPVQPPRRSRRRPILIGAGVAAVVAIVLVVVLVMAVGRAVSTVNTRVITPAPTAVAGLTRDHAAESNPQFQAAMAHFRSQYSAVLHHQVTSYAVGIYTNVPPGSSGSASSIALLYMGFNATSLTLDPASAIKSAIGGVGQTAAISSTISVTGLPGDTSAECVSGTAGGRPLAVCGWATDKTLALFVSLNPNTTVSQLASLMKKMRPGLVRN